MDHGDHGGHGGHGGDGGHDMPMGPKCNLHMLWNTQIEDTCVVFESWHISSRTALFISCVVIIGLGVLHEYLRLLQHRFDQHVALVVSKGKITVPASGRSSGRSTPERGGEDVSLLNGRKIFRTSSSGIPVPIVFRLLRAGLYGASVFLSFFLMLVFMTYNAYLITATVLGAAVGHYVFGATINPDAILGASGAGKGMACH